MVIDALVAQALDDLDQGNLEPQAALHGVARAAYNAAQRAAQPAVSRPS